MTFGEAQKKGQKLLADAGIDEAALDSRLLMEHCTGKDHGWLLAHMDNELSKGEEASFFACIDRRCKREPLQHITGCICFMGIELKCDARALIPRQETELLAELAIEAAKKRPKMKALDLCTGSGCIAISLEKTGHFEAVTACDISRDALNLASENAKKSGACVEFVQGDLFGAVAGRRFDIIVSNPPYISSGELKTLMPEVLKYDPVPALDGGEDGLDFYRRIAGDAMEYLNPDGRLFLEIGDTQAGSIEALLLKAGFRDVAVIRDYSQKDRIITAQGGAHV